MKDIEIPPFYVGQEVVANSDHSDGAFKKGDEFVVLSIRKGCCSYEIYIGILKSKPNTTCTNCGRINFEGLGVPRFFMTYRFSPKIEISDFISMKQLAETQLEIIGAN